MCRPYKGMNIRDVPLDDENKRLEPKGYRRLSVCSISCKISCDIFLQHRAAVFELVAFFLHFAASSCTAQSRPIIFPSCAAPCG